MLLVAGTDRLDKPLTIAQMQGKFQLVLMPTSGKYKGAGAGGASALGA